MNKSRRTPFFMPVALAMGLPLLCSCAVEEAPEDSEAQARMTSTYMGFQDSPTEPGLMDPSVDDDANVMERNPNCHARVPARAWRIRNATRSRANAWSLRGLRFCTNSDCTSYASGSVFDDGHSPTWGAPESLFDEDNSNFWKSFAGRRPGQAYVGLEFNRAIAVTAIGLRPDNVVYGVSSIFIEYFDEDADAWITHTTLEDVPLHYGDIGSGGPTYRNNVWYVAPLKRCGPVQGSGDPAVVELAL